MTGSLHRFLVFSACALLLSLTSLARAALAPSAEEVHPLPVGAKAPALELPDADGATVDLATVFAPKPTVLIFYRGGWCPFCNRHLAALAELEPKLRALGYQIVGISADLPADAAATREKHGLRYRLLSDRGMKASEAYGLAYRVSAEQAAKYHSYGIELPPVPGGSDCWLPVPAAFIVARDGVVKFVYSNADPAVGVSDTDLLAAAEAAAK